MIKNIFKPILFSTEMVQAILAGRKTQTRRVCSHQFWQHSELTDFNINKIHSKVDRSVSSKYQPGDILWVRETFAKPPLTAFGKEYIHKAGFDRTFCGWKPSIHMPKEAARIFLKVTNVRCERLQDITREDCKDEGINYIEGNRFGHRNYYNYLTKSFQQPNSGRISPSYSFQTLWDSINAKKHPLESNPWVWVYEFERIEKPADFI